MASCSWCHQNVTWAQTISGRKVPLDPTPGWAGRYIVEQGQTGALFAKVQTGKPTAPNRYRFHRCPANQRAGR